MAFAAIQTLHTNFNVCADNHHIKHTSMSNVLLRENM